MQAEAKAKEVAEPLTRLEWLLQLCGVAVLVYMALAALA